MSIIKNLRQRRADLVSEAQSLFDTAAKENRGLTPQEAERDDAISAELASVDGDISRAERQADRQRQLALQGDRGVVEAAAAAMGQTAPGRGAFGSIGDFMVAVMKAGMPNAQRDDRLQWYAGPTGAGEGVSADGGFLVQTDLAAPMLDSLFTGGDIASRIRKLPISENANGAKLPMLDETSRANGSRWGGVQAYWTGEAGLMTASQPKFRRMDLDLEKVTALFYATDELMADTTLLSAFMNMAIPEEIQFKVEDAIVNGTGAGMPLGFLNSPSLITVTKEASQPNTTIVAENILKMWTRMPARMRSRAVWFINQDVEPQLHQLNVKIKNVAGTENVGGIVTPPVIYSPAGQNGSTLPTLMGRPVVPVEYAATLGAVGDIILADLSQYLGIDKGGVQSAASIHVRFLYNEQTFRWVYRFNGAPVWAAPITPYKGSTTQSPFIVLQAR